MGEGILLGGVGVLSLGLDGPGGSSGIISSGDVSIWSCTGEGVSQSNKLGTRSNSSSGSVWSLSAVSLSNLEHRSAVVLPLVHPQRECQAWLVGSDLVAQALHQRWMNTHTG